MLIDEDRAARVGLHADALKPKAVAVRCASDGEEDVIGVSLERLGIREPAAQQLLIALDGDTLSMRVPKDRVPFLFEYPR